VSDPGGAFALMAQAQAELADIGRPAALELRFARVQALATLSVAAALLELRQTVEDATTELLMAIPLATSPRETDIASPNTGRDEPT
jgi:hypothetical protein